MIENIENEDFEELSPNMQKYFRYRDIKSKLNKAIDEKFYYEAILLEYGILEDRISGVLKYDDLRNSDNINQKAINGLKDKVNILNNGFGKENKEKNDLLHHYFNHELQEKIKTWAEKRNECVHFLMDLSKFNISDIKEIAEEGRELVRVVSNKSKCYKDKLKRLELKSNGHN